MLFTRDHRQQCHMLVCDCLPANSLAHSDFVLFVACYSVALLTSSRCWTHPFLGCFSNSCLLREMPVLLYSPLISARRTRTSGSTPWRYVCVCVTSSNSCKHLQTAIILKLVAIPCFIGLLAPCICLHPFLIVFPYRFLLCPCLRRWSLCCGLAPQPRAVGGSMRGPTSLLLCHQCGSTHRRLRLVLVLVGSLCLFHERPLLRYAAEYSRLLISPKSLSPPIASSCLLPRRFLC